MSVACVSAAVAAAVLCWTAVAPANSRVAYALDDYWQERDIILLKQRTLQLGGRLLLTHAEDLANAVLMEAKYREVDEGFDNPSDFNPSQHFFLRKPFIEQSAVFDIIKRMPKGAALHVHDTALIGGDYLVKNITYRDNLYMCQKDDGIELIFSASTPQSDTCTFQLLKNVRESYGDVEEFDANLGKHFTLETNDPKNQHPDVNVVWQEFGKIFGTITPMLTYKPVWEDYFYEALRQYRDDNIFYVELRTTLPDLYDLEGNIYDSIQCANVYKQANDRFIKDYPDTMGSRIIYAPLRGVEPYVVNRYMEILIALKNQLGDFVAGFDLVGQEDAGKPLKEFLPQLIDMPGSINVFYHSGETNWFGTSTDYNLIDAVLLGAKRIGHAYALLKHPTISNIVKEEEIAIEVNPISNQVLSLVADLRNHPASIMLANDFPVVISSDDPGLWGALPLSHDIYEAFMGLASRHSDIRLLKQLALNSIKYSVMTAKEKQKAIEVFEARWKVFVDSLYINPDALQS